MPRHALTTGILALALLLAAALRACAQTPPPPALPPPTELLLDTPDGSLGWFFAAEVGVVAPHVRNRLAGSVLFDGGGSWNVAVPGACLDVTAAPRLEAGYRLPDGLGSFLFSYRFLASEGRQTFANYDALGDGRLKSRLDLNVFDLDYASSEYEPAPHWEMTWRVGARLADSFYDSRVQGAFVGQRVSNHFVGAGPHLGLDLWRRLPLPGVALYLRGEGALLVGEVRQGFEQTFAFRDGSRLGAASSVRNTHAVPTLGVQGGVAWTPPGWDGWRLSAGYLFEAWWYLGATEGSRLNLYDQGLFLRAERKF